MEGYATVYDANIDDLIRMLQYMKKFTSEVDIVIHPETNRLILDPHGSIPAPPWVKMIPDRHKVVDGLYEYDGTAVECDDPLTDTIIDQLTWGMRLMRRYNVNQ